MPAPACGHGWQSGQTLSKGIRCLDGSGEEPDGDGELDGLRPRRCGRRSGGDLERLTGGDRERPAGGDRGRLAGGDRGRLAGGCWSRCDGGDGCLLAGGRSLLDVE